MKTKLKFINVALSKKETCLEKGNLEFWLVTLVVKNRPQIVGYAHWYRNVNIA